MEHIDSALTPCTFTIDLQDQRFTALTAPEDIFGVDAARILVDMEDFRRLSPAKFCRAVGLYFCRADEAGLPYRAYTALSCGQSYCFHAHMRNAVTRRFTPCEVRIAPSADGRTASGQITPEA